MEVVRHRRPSLDQQLHDVAPAQLVEHAPEITRELQRRVHPGAGGRRPEHHPQRLPRCHTTVEPDRQSRVVGPHGASPDQHRIGEGAQEVRVGAGPPRR